MIEFKIFSASTCSELLNFSSNEELRNKYNAESFDHHEATFLPQTLRLDAKSKDLILDPNPRNDFDSAMKIFNALNYLDHVQANDKRIWVTLTHTLFFKYCKERWGITKSSSNDAIKDRFHFEGAALRQRNQNSIARLWWSAKMTYDGSRNDPFELTKILWEKQDFYQNLIDRKFSTYRGIFLGFLNFYARNRHLDLKHEMRKLFRGMNALGGVKVLPLLQEKEVESELYKLCSFYKIKVN